jgi:hypothetical protein
MAKKQDVPLIGKIVACHRLVHDEPGMKPSVRIRVECEAETGPMVLLLSPAAANDLAAQLKGLRAKKG